MYLDGDAAPRRRGVKSEAWNVSLGVALVLAMVPCQAALAQPAVSALVIPFEHPADEPSLQWLGDGIAVLLSQGDCFHGSQHGFMLFIMLCIYDL